jgi:acyl-CoA synthetase (AMP-forming)/AMP-acid ligase II
VERINAIDTEAVLKYCRERLSTFKIPQKIVIVNQLEMTGSGKVKRN